MSLADAFMSTADDLYLLPPNQALMQVTYSADEPSPDTDIRARAYTLARQELPDAPVEDVMCRAETIAKFLKGETA